MCDDLNDLLHFKNVSSMDPEAYLRQLEAYKLKCEHDREAFVKIEKDFMINFDKEREDAERIIIDQAMKVVVAAKYKLKDGLLYRTTAAHYENTRLKTEISVFC